MDNSKSEVATLAGGCFWCIEAVLEQLQGVQRVESGYIGGDVPNPSYQLVCTGTTGHAEAVQVTFDPDIISYRDLLQVFFAVHDPTTLNRQGPDVGTQYRSEVFAHTDEQEDAARAVIAEIDAARVWDRRIVTEVSPATDFYPHMRRTTTGSTTGATGPSPTARSSSRPRWPSSESSSRAGSSPPQRSGTSLPTLWRRAQRRERAGPGRVGSGTPLTG